MVVVTRGIAEKSADESGTGDSDRAEVELPKAGNSGESYAVAMRRLELEHARGFLRPESEERIAMRRIEVEGKMTRPESSSGSDTSDSCRMDPFSQCAKVLKGRKLPCDADVPVWFEEVEKIFSTFGVPQNNRVHFIMPAPSERVRYLFASLSAEEVADYERVKAAVLEELRLTPGEYLRRFETASKRKDEGWTQFASRVKGYFTYYLDARGADTKQDLVERIIADRVKNGLGKDSLKYVILREGEGWMKAHKIAKILQTFEEAEGKGHLAKVVEASVDNGAAPATKGGRAGRPFRCYECQKEGHLARDCPTRKSKPGAQPGAGSKVSRIQSIVVGEDEPAPDTSGLLVAKLATGPPQAACTSSLQRVEIVCAGVPTNAILDTGCEITVIREGLLPTSAGDPSGSIHLISAFGQAIKAKLAHLPLQLRHDGTVVDGAQINIVCALTDELAPGVDCLLTGEDWALLTGGAGPSSASQRETPVEASVGGKTRALPILTAAHFSEMQSCDWEFVPSADATVVECGSLIPGSRLLRPAMYTAGDDCLEGSSSLIPGSRLLLPARYTAGDDCLKGCGSLIPGSRLLRPAMYTAGDDCLEGSSSLIPGSRLLLPARYTAGDDCLKGCGSLIPGSRLLRPAMYTAGDDCLEGSSSLIPGSRLLLPAMYTAGDDCLEGCGSLIPGSRLLLPARYTAGDDCLKGCGSLIPGSRLLRPAMYTAGDDCLKGCGSLIPGSRLLLPARYTAGDDCLKGCGSLIPGSRLLRPAMYTAGDDCLKGCGSLIPGSRLLLPARYTAGDDCLGGSSSLIPGSRLLRPARYTAGDNSLDSEGTVVKGLKVRLSCGSESYNVVRELVAPLPSERTLQRRLQQHKFPPGILIEMMKPLEVKVGLMSPAERHAVLMMDEIQLNEGLDYDATTGTVIGRPTIGLSSGKLPDSCLATHGFVFMLGGMSTRWKQTVAYEFTENSFSAATVKTTIDTLIRRCEQIGIKVHALVTDMGGGNQALWRAYGILVGKHSKETCYANHPCDPARRLYFVADVPHLLKNLRNHLIRGQDIYLPDEVVKKNALPTDTVSIKQVEQLLELDEQSDMRVAPRLKKACISPGHYAKMKVGPAYTLFHHDTAAGLRYLVKLGRLDEEALTTAWFFEQVQRWFELMSSRTKVVAFSHKAQAGLDFLKDFITLFQDLAIGSRVRVWKPIQTGVILSTTSAMELQTMMVGDHHFEYLLFSRLSQDALENLFSTIRLKNPVPRPKEFKSALRTVTLAQFLRPSSHGSYTKADGELLVGLENSAPEDPDPPPLQPGLLDLDTAEQDSFEYLCGYAVQQVKKNLKTCNNCSAAICAERPMQDANDLVRLKSYTSNRIALVVPSKATLSLLEAAERYYRRNEKLVIDNSLSIHNLRSSILDATGPCEIPVCHDVPMKLLRCFLSTRLHMTLRKLNQQIRDKKQSAKCGSRSVGMRHAVVNI
ncbi:hypothetical protein ISCGN_008207 [Ixodes scapularis]